MLGIQNLFLIVLNIGLVIFINTKNVEHEDNEIMHTCIRR